MPQIIDAPPRTSAHFSAADAHDCLIATCRKVLRRMHPGDAARWMSCSEDTVERMIKTESPGQWTIARLMDLRAAELAVLGTDEVGRALDQARAGAARRADPRRATEDLRHLMAVTAAACAEQAAALRDGHADLGELARLVESAPAIIAEFTQFVADADARIKEVARV